MHAGVARASLMLQGTRRLLATGETEFQSLTPGELRVCRAIVATNGQRVAELDLRWAVAND